MMKNSAWRWVAFAVQLLIVLVVLAYVGKAAAGLWPEMRSLHWRLSPLLLVGALLAGIGTQALLVVGWRLALRLVGADIPWRGAITSQLLGQLAKYVPGKLLTLIGKGYLASRVGASESQAVLAMFVEAAAQVTTSLAVGAVYVVAVGAQERRFLPLAAVVVLLSIAALHPAVLPRAVGFALRLMGRRPVALHYQVRAVVPLAGCYLAFWGATGLGVWLLGRGLGLNAPLVPVIAVFCLSWAAGFLSFIFPGGLGVRETAFTTLLGVWVGQGAALSLALVSRGWMLALELLGALFVWILRLACRPEGPPTGAAEVPRADEPVE